MSTESLRSYVARLLFGSSCIASPKVQAIDENWVKFRLEEYKALRAEIDSRIKEGNNWESIAIAGIAAVYSWLATNSDKPVAAIGWWVPVLFPLFGLVRQCALLVRIMQIASYLRDMEVAFAQHDPTGWETYLKRRRQEAPIRSRLISFSAILMWIVLLAITIAIGWLSMSNFGQPLPYTVN